MVRLITGLIGVVMVVVFLGYYAYMIGSIPLWLIIVAILAMAIADYVQSLRTDENADE
ncbi:MAG: hypothetical protein ACE5HM_03850 [Acidiferrobacterales bacterium]